MATNDQASLSRYLDRQRRARDEMHRRGVDILFVTPSSDMLYLTGYPARPSERLTLLAIPRDGNPFIVVPRLEAARLAHWRGEIDVHIWDETDSPYELVSHLVEGASGNTVGISDHARAIVLLELLDLMPDAEFGSATPVLRELRMIKDEWEINQLRIASERTDSAWEDFVAISTVGGRTERDVAQDITNLLAKHGLTTIRFLTVASGPASASPHHITSDRIIQRGDSIVIDFGATWNHYTSDLTRTVFVGEPPEDYLQAYDVVLRANHAAYEAVRPGVRCEEIDKAARDVIEQAGYGEYFIHRLGHGIGLDGHEDPYLVAGNALPMRAGMVFSDEPGIYISDRFGIRIEDSVVCRDDGAERLNHCRRELTVMH